MNKIISRLVVCVLACLPVVQRAAAQRFEAADVHASAGVPAIHLPALNSHMRGGLGAGGRYELRTATLVDLISTAWKIRASEVIGGPDWLNTDQFDVLARAPSDVTPESLGLMLQAFLKDRFGLIVHNGVKAFPEYALTAGTRTQIEQAAGGESGCTQTTIPGPIQSTIVSCHNVSMPEFASRLPRLAGDYFQSNPVADMTGLTGGWSFTVKWTRRNWLNAAGADGISLSDALQKQLGLKLAIQDVPVPVLMVDSVNRKPSDNPPGTSQKLPVMPAGFEVADIRLSAPGTTQRGFRSDPGGRVGLQGFTIADLIKFAWEIADMDVIDNDDMLVGQPRWPERFDIVAKALVPGPQTGSRLDVDTVRIFVRSLLSDRFRLTTHFTEQPVSVYAMTAPKPRLQKADPSNRPECRNAPAPSGSLWVFSIVCRNTTMAQLAEGLPAYGALYIPHPVIDKTGLEGGWDFTLSWSPPHLVHGDEAGQPSDPNGSLTIVEALEKQLGLKLEPKKYPMPVLVIDHVEREPTQN